MTGEDLMIMAIAFLETEKQDLERQNAKFNLQNPDGLQQWQIRILEKDQKRIQMMSGLIQIIQAQEIEDTTNQGILEAIEKFDKSLEIKGKPDLRDYVIDQLIIHLEGMSEVIETMPKGLAKISLGADIRLIDQLLSDYKIKFFTANNIPYVIKD